MKLSMSSQEVRRRRQDGDDFELVASEPAFPTPAETEVVDTEGGSSSVEKAHLHDDVRRVRLWFSPRKSN
jgi:hypothetical protein